MIETQLERDTKPVLILNNKKLDSQYLIQILKNLK